MEREVINEKFAETEFVLVVGAYDVILRASSP
jgi:hypothetical protein